MLGIDVMHFGYLKLRHSLNVNQLFLSIYSFNAISISSLSFLADPVLSITNIVHCFHRSSSIDIDVLRFAISYPVFYLPLTI